MKLSVIGCGYLGAVHAASMAELGHDVIGIDIDAAIDGLIPYLSDGDLVVGKSTVPLGTVARLAEKVTAASGAQLAWNPEFLREGFAVKDTISPDRLVYGLPAESAAADQAKAQLDPVAVAGLAEGRTIIDGRNVLDAAAWRAAGWTYRGLGREQVRQHGMADRAEQQPHDGAVPAAADHEQ